MSDASTKFGTMLNCMDGRTQEPVVKWMKEQFGVDVIDAPNPAGPTNMIVKGEKAVVDHYVAETLISVNGHKSQNVVVIAHQDCAKNPISDEDQIAELKQAVEIVATQWSIPAGVLVTGLWMTKITDLDWGIEKIVEKLV